MVSSAQASYGPQTITGGVTTTGLTVPAGTWTVGHLLWGASITIPQDTSINQGAVSYFYDTGSWFSSDDFSDVTNDIVTGAFSVTNPSSTFTIWTGPEPSFP